VPSTENSKILFENILIQYNTRQVRIFLYDTPLGLRWIEALKDNLKQQRVLEKNFCFLGWPDSKRDLHYLCEELNKNIAQINSFKFNPEYPKLQTFKPFDFQHPFPELKLKHDACNQLHRYFEELQGTVWNLSTYYKQADHKTKYAIRQLNNLCHEIESLVLAIRKKFVAPDWIRPSQITTFLNAPRHELHKEDFELFKSNRYDRELGGVYLHWSQIGKTLYEVFRDEGGTKMNEATCSEINHQKYYSGEFDIEWGDDITEQTSDWKKNEMNEFRAWLKLNNYDWEDPKLALGYIKIGQVDMKLGFQNKPFLEVYNQMKNNLNIKSIHTIGSYSVQCEYPYSLDSEDWKRIQMDRLKEGYESHSLR